MNEGGEARESAADGTAGDVTGLSYRVRDGLKLFARRYDPPPGGRERRPVLCLPGLTRNGRDFDRLARHLSRGAPASRTVYTIDCRGRGLSDRDPDWRNYTVPVEAQDVLDFLAMTGAHGAAVIGTSRGGLVAMVIAALAPTAIGPVVLNDIGPVIEREGLLRIAGYVGRLPVPSTWEDATRIVAEASRTQFPAVPEADWADVARQWFNERDGRPVAGYDPALARSLSIADVPPSLWPQFGTLARKPLLIVRGERSDILSAATVAEMLRRHPRSAAIEVPGQGHAPLLRDWETIDRIAAFLAAQDTA